MVGDEDTGDNPFSAMMGESAPVSKAMFDNAPATWQGPKPGATPKPSAPDGAKTLGEQFIAA